MLYAIIICAFVLVCLCVIAAVLVFFYSLPAGDAGANGEHTKAALVSRVRAAACV